ncbi:hypothetical protein H9Q69_003703 [Fusarium xylarioides]|nr:hypothetical protein H9Q69_003703 [Fusarium xylarioides]
MSDHIDPISDALADFFGNFHDRRDSPPGQPTAQFGHIKTPPYRLKPDIELEVSSGYLCISRTTIEILTYHGLFERIRSNFNRHANQSDHAMWLKCPDPEKWYMDNRLPPKIVIIFHINPNIPADCAISLAGIVEWLLAQSALPGYVIRLVTISAGEDCNLLKKLLDTSGLQYHFTDLDLAQYGELDPMRNCTVVNRSSWTPKCQIFSHEALKAKEDPEDGQFISMGKLSIGSTLSDIGPLNYIPMGPKTRLMLISPDLAILPITSKPFEEIHIVVGYSKTTQAWDLGMHQMVCRDYPLSMEERRRQLWWAYQGNEKSVFMHIKDGLSPHAYIEQGVVAPRFVEAHQLGGFIATVTSLPWFPRNREDTIRIFATNPFTVQAITDRLITQRVTKSKGSALTENEAGIFIDVLPLLNYDYRLALLVATEASPNVNRVKTQLAAMLTTKLEDIVMLGRVPRLPDCVFKECRGFSPSLAGQGSMWLFLGLLRNRDQHIQEHRKYMSLYDNLDGFVSVDESVGENVEKNFIRLADLLSRHGRDINHRPSLSGRGRGSAHSSRGGIQKDKPTSLTHNVVTNKALASQLNNTIAAPSGQSRHGVLSAVSTPRQAYIENIGSEYDYHNEVVNNKNDESAMECAFCERKTHKIDKHLDLPSGDLPGCILCHSMQHNTEDCAKMSDMSLTQKIRIFVDGRADLPPLRTRVPWWDMLHTWLQDDRSRGQDLPVGFPWSKEFSIELSCRHQGRYIRDIQAYVDHSCRHQTSFIKDETTATLDAVYLNYVAEDGGTWVTGLAKRALEGAPGGSTYLSG